MRNLILVSLSSVVVTACSGGEVIDLGGDAGQSTRGPSPSFEGGLGTSSGAGAQSSSGGGASYGAGASSDGGEPIGVPEGGPPTGVYPFPDASALVCAPFDAPPADAGASAYSIPLPATGSPASASDGWILYDSNVDSNTTGIYAIHPDGSGMRSVLIVGSEPAVSPDGSELVVTDLDESTPQLALFRMSGGGGVIAEGQALTSMSAGADQAAFSPDGKLIAFRSGDSVYVMNADGSGIRAVASSYDIQDQFFEHPTFSPDGTMLLVQENTWYIDVFDLSGNRLGTAVGYSSTGAQWPALSRDGRELAFIAGSSCARSQLRLVAFGANVPDPCDACQASGGNLGLLTHPSWGPGTLITYSHQSSNGLKRIVVEDTAHPDVEPVEILQDMGNQQNPVWAPTTFKP
jgi:hypothetical protein